MDRNREPLFDGRLPEQLDKEIEELIKSSNNMRVKASMIPLFWSDDLRTKYREECHEYLHENQEDQEDKEIRTSILVNILNSYKSEKKELKAICDEFEGRTKESGEALSIVISNLSHNKIKTELSDMLLHRVHQLRVIAHLSHDKETDSWFEKWKKDYKYGETMETIAKHEKDFRAKKPDNKYRGLSINSLIDKLKEPSLSDEERLEIIGGYEVPDSNATHERVRSIDDVDSTIKVRLEEMMLERVNQNDDRTEREGFEWVASEKTLKPNNFEPTIPVNAMSPETRRQTLEEAIQLFRMDSYSEDIRRKLEKKFLEAIKPNNSELTIPVNAMSPETRKQKLEELFQLIKMDSYSEDIRRKLEKEFLEAMKGSNQQTGEYKEFD